MRSGGRGRGRGGTVEWDTGNNTVHSSTSYSQSTTRTTSSGWSGWSHISGASSCITCSAWVRKEEEEGWEDMETSGLLTVLYRTSPHKTGELLLQPVHSSLPTQTHN